MANTELVKTYIGKVDFQGKQGYAVIGTPDAKVNNTAVVTLGALNGAGIGAVVDDGMGAGTPITVARAGFVQVMAGAAINAFDKLKIDANGCFIPAVAAGDIVVATADEAIAQGALGFAKIETPAVIKIA